MSGFISFIFFFGFLFGTTSHVGDVDAMEQGRIESTWEAEWWAFPTFSLIVLAATFVVGFLFPMLTAATATGHAFGVLASIPYAFFTLDSLATPLGALVALPIAGFAMFGNAARYNAIRNGVYG